MTYENCKGATMENINFLGKDWKVFEGYKKFWFTCDKCGKCCAKIDVMLNPYDVARISEHLKITSADFVKQYCKLHIGDSSKLPILTLITEPKCVFSENGLCQIHEARPVICRSYPCGRVGVYDKENLSMQEKWILNDPCSKIPFRAQKQWTIREYIESQGAREYYEVEQAWHTFTVDICSKNLVREDDTFRNLFITICYLAVNDNPERTELVIEMMKRLGADVSEINATSSCKEKMENTVKLARWLFITKRTGGN